MKNSWAIILLLSAGQVVYGQYSNDWIDYNQSYYKIMTGQDGVYRITYDDLVQAGLPVSTIDPRKLQIFHRGEELSIKVAGQQDARLDPGDYLEFYGQRNDGTVDRALYQPNAAQPHGYYNLFSDSTACFLTWKLNTETGKRIANYKENNVASLPAQTANNQEIIQLNTSRYARGRNLANRVYLTRFDYGEGWTGDLFQENQSVDYVLTGIVNAVQPAGIPKLEIQIMGESTIGHQAEIYAGPNAASLSLVQTITFNAFAAQTIFLDLSWPMINAAGELTVRVKALGINGGNDLLSVPYLKLNYPRTFDLTGQSGYLSLFPDAADKSYIEVNNPPVGAVIWDVTMPNHPIETGYNLIDPVMNAVVRNTAAGRQLFVFNNTITPVLKKVNMRLLDPLTADYLIITHKNLMQPTGSYTDPVRAYAAYRASAVGGTYDTLVVDIDQLYNQFSYGEITPLAIFRFVEYMQQGNPRYMFLIGKGLDVRHNYHRNPAAFTYHDLVPTAGYPGSDNAFTAGLDQFNFTPAFAVGRITASAPDEVGAYLEKVKEMEATPFNALWRKNLLHLSGGITPDEQSVFFTYMEGFRKIAEDIYLGGKVKTIRKNTTETVTQINISDEINSGLNFVTFLGHSNPNVIDIDVGFASDPINGYNNKGKYPMLLINGCEAGLIYNNNRLFGEDWILTPEKGAVGFMAHSSYGAAYFLRGYTDMLYQNAFGDSVLRNKTIGEVRMQTIRDYLALFGTINMWHPAQVQQLIYLGDPALKTFGAGTPDYQTQNSALTVRPFDQQMVTAQTDSFALDIIVKNYGTATRDSLKIRVERIISDGRILTYDTVFAPVFYQDTLSFVLHNDFFNPMNGDNTFRVFIDPLYEVAEIDEMNNMAEIRYFIPLNGTRNLIPADYAIVPGTSVNLLAQTTDLFSPLKSVVFELDTAFTFDSPFKKTLTAMGTVLSSTVVTLLPVDSTIYYWRTRLANPGPDESSQWNQSSFTYINNSPEGWNQGHFPQFTSISTQGMTSNQVIRQWEFLKNKVDVSVLTYGDLNPATNTNVSVTVDGAEYIINNLKPCLDHTLNFMAFDKSTAIPYAAVPFIYQDPRTCGRQPQIINSYSTARFDVGGGDVVEYINAVNTGDTVILFTIGDVKYSLWTANMKSKLAEIGFDATTLTGMADGDPLIVVGRKGAAVGTAVVIKAATLPANEQEISLIRTITGATSSGTLVSPLIGPAVKWSSFSRRVRFNESPTYDQYSFDVIGVNNTGAEVVLHAGVVASSLELGGTSAVNYPHLRLRFNTTDTVDLTPTQLRRWTVVHDGAPEGVLVTDMLRDETIRKQEAEPFLGRFYFVNVSDNAFADSLLKVSYTIINKDTRLTVDSVKWVPAPAAGDTTVFDLNFPTKGITGFNDLVVFVNPRVAPEMHYGNNRMFIPAFLQVYPDELNPVMEVTFDGRYILDGEIVNARPVIRITLKDENPYLTLSDTTYLQVYIRKECAGCVDIRVPFSSPLVSWSVDEATNEMVFEYNSNVFEDGRYTLRVESMDATGNKSGEEPYLVNFEIVNESTITHFYPYPNPFTDRMQFIFTLTGTELPDEILIRIMTITGRVVREVTMEELGPLHIGNNITDFYWDGTDQYGNRLANGVYLYKAFVRIGGMDIKHRDTSADQGFKNGLGKIYIAR